GAGSVEADQRPAAPAAAHPRERVGQAVQGDLVGDHPGQVDAAVADVSGQHRDVAGRVARAVHAAAQRTGEVEELQGAEGDRVVLGADADDGGGAAAAGH